MIIMLHFTDNYSDLHFKMFYPLFPTHCRYRDISLTRTGSLPWNLYTVELLSQYMALSEICPPQKYLLHLMYKVKLATLAYKIFYDYTPPSMGHILVIVKKSSPKNLSADWRSTVGRLLVDCRPSVGRLLVDCRPFVGRLSAVCRPTDSQQVFPKT